MKHKFSLLEIILMISLVITFGIILNQNNHKSQILIKNSSNISNGSMISMMVEQDDGSYKEQKDSAWPNDEYEFNAKLSKCENGSEISFEDGNIKVSAIASDKCYAYFDIKKTIGRLCKNQEFANCVISNYQIDNTIIYHNTEALANTNIANKELSANDNSYRYSGASNTVNNFVCLDGVETQNGACTTDADLYRIIGFFPNEAGEYEMKLIKATEGTKTELGDNSTAEGGAYYSSSYYYYWNSSKGTGSSDGNTNMWQYSNLNKVNLNGYYLNTYLAKVGGLSNHITEHKWTTGGFPYSSTYNAQQVYNKELGTEKLTTSDNKCYSEDNKSTAQTCTEEDLTYTAKIGLMYVSDYGYAAYPDAWNRDVSSSNGYGSKAIKENNWMVLGKTEWTVSRSSASGNTAWTVGTTGTARNFVVYNSNGVRPVFYLESSTKIKSGDGSKTNPFRLSWD